MTHEQFIKESPVECRHCTGQMAFMKIRKHPGNWPYILAALGLFLTVFLVGPIVGIPMALIGFYMAQATETVSLCRNCGYFYKAHLGEYN